MLRPICALAALAAALAGAAPLHLRLETPLTSYESRQGETFRTVVIAPYERDGRVLIPAGAIVHGTVRCAKAVHMGVVRERATLVIEFDRYELPDGRSFPIAARVRRIDNARETVTGRGDIRGILAANSPQSLVGGLWLSPKPELLSRSFIGLTGASGRLVEEYSMGPFGAAGLFVVRCALFRLPEPEIRLPAGTELDVVVTAAPADAPTFDREPEARVPAEFVKVLQARPVAVWRPGGGSAADVINVALAGSRQDVVRAFENAGWVAAEPMNRSSLSRSYRAYSAQSGFAAAPVSKLLYGGQDPDLVFEKSLNSVAKRHHIRIWKASDDLWLAAATHDVRVAFQSGAFTHRIDPRIDFERTKVVNDLAFAGCAGPAGYVERPGAAREPDGSGAGVLTDGRLALISLRPECGAGAAAATMEVPDPPRTRTVRLVRRMILEGRQYVLRGHPYYWAYRLVTLQSSRRRQADLDE